MHPDWIIPDWPAPQGVQAVCTTRAGGVSKAPYATLNLGDHVGDDPVAVEVNRARLQQAIQARPVFLSQVHGVEVAELSVATVHGKQTDACVTAQAGVACAVMVADCLPVLLTNSRGTAVAAAHAGWRGLAGGVLDAALQSLFKENQAVAPVDVAQAAIEVIATDMSKEVLVWLGPCIGPDAFEVGAEVRAAFVARNPLAAQHFKPGAATGKYWADLAGLARQCLMTAGVSPAQIHGNDSSPEWCTVSNPSRFFSHRRDGVALGGTGRMAACVWLG
jgi:copper oxidase (laccase) domain-containing protein